MSAIILDTETHDMHGLPIEIAYVPFELSNGTAKTFADQAFEQRYSCGQPIAYGAMAVHHILESDIADQPSFKTFKLPDDVTYIIGHNIDYDIAAISRCGVDVSNIKAICTLALARELWPSAAHNLSALTYMLMEGGDLARQRLRNAHNAKADVMLTAFILKSIINMMEIQDIEHLYQASQEARIPKVMAFGKHKGVAIKDLPKDYVTWLLKQTDVDPYLMQALQAYMVAA